MAKYVTHKHGLTIGSDNIFFISDQVVDTVHNEPPIDLPEEVSVFRDNFRAILSFDNYHFDSINSLTVRIRTPAQQMCWQPWKLEWEHNGLPYENYYVKPSSWFKNWLSTNVGKEYDSWDTYTRCPFLRPVLFFDKRSDAVKTVKMIKERLYGISL